jgi:hypothetical protein
VYEEETYKHRLQKFRETYSNILTAGWHCFQKGDRWLALLSEGRRKVAPPHT